VRPDSFVEQGTLQTHNQFVDGSLVGKKSWELIPFPIWKTGQDFSVVAHESILDLFKNFTQRLFLPLLVFLVARGVTNVPP
jgi:hypothetical protein